MADPRLELAVADRVATLRLNRPAKRNALDQAMWEAMPGLVTEALARGDVRVLVLTSAVPGVFCAGADIAEFAAESRDAAWRARNQTAIRATQRALATADKPVLAVIDGDCIGGGCGMALACDFRIASPASRFGITPARLGLVYPLHDTKLLVDLVGPAWARRLLLTGTLVDAATASRIGLIDQLAQDPAAAARELVGQLLAVSGDSQRWVKAMIRRILDGTSDDDEASRALFDAAFTGPDFAEGVAAFLERRAPRFR